MTKSSEPYTPYGRNAQVHEITESDAQVLKRTPEPLKVLIPVTIEESRPKQR